MTPRQDPPSPQPPGCPAFLGAWERLCPAATIPSILLVADLGGGWPAALRGFLLGGGLLTLPMAILMVLARGLRHWALRVLAGLTMLGALVIWWTLFHGALNVPAPHDARDGLITFVALPAWCALAAVLLGMALREIDGLLIRRGH